MNKSRIIEQQRTPRCRTYLSSIEGKRCSDTNRIGFRFEQTLNNTLLNLLIVVILRYFNKSMYILVLIKGCLYP
jgi:hypothetical protein